jgi:hypothetical protein
MSEGGNMSETLQYVIVGVLVLAAVLYAVWRLGPAALRRKFRKSGSSDEGGCSSCSANSERRR